MDIRNLKTGDPFISLEEFMLLPDCSYYQTDRLWGVNLSGPEWVKRYQIAKESWEKYGTNPPMNTMVCVLVNGHGTGFPFLSENRRLEMNWLPKQMLQERETDKFNFGLVRKTTDSRGSFGATSLLDKALWWRSVYVLKDSITKGE